jgi:4-amino-4-deoxy-L-arabinose transferase-like glycosyltransferase
MMDEYPSIPTRPRRLVSFARHSIGRSFGRLGVPAHEWAALIPILFLAVADRFVSLPNRYIWDADQGFEVGAIWNAVVTRQLPALGSPAFTTGGTFHHGALFYDLMIPVAWVSNGDPNAIVTAIAILGLLVVPLVWWTARSIGGQSAGLAAAVLAAVSPSLIDYSTLIWNPVLVELGVALACFGAWQAWTTRGPRWWLVAAAGTAVASQAHLTGLVLVFPMAALYLVAIRRSPAAERRRLIAWGQAGAALFVLTWVPWIAYELTHDFAETRGILAFQQPGPPGADPLSRFLIGTIRILAWPLTHWPLSDFNSGFPAASIVAVVVATGMIWRVTGALAAKPERTASATAAGNGSTGAVDSTGSTGSTGSTAALGAVDPEARHASIIERQGLLFVGGSLLFIAAVLSLGLKQLSEFANINQEQYHVVADVFVILAAGLVVGGLWRAAPLRGRPWSGHVLASLVLAGLVAVGVAHWPPLTASDGGWPAAQAAAAGLERDAGGGTMALVSLPSFNPSDAYGYPLRRDGARMVAPGEADTVVVLCAVGFQDGCGGAAEDAWIATNLPGRGLELVRRFSPAPNRILSVYRRAP